MTRNARYALLFTIFLTCFALGGGLITSSIGGSFWGGFLLSAFIGALGPISVGVSRGVSLALDWADRGR